MVSSFHYDPLSCDKFVDPLNIRIVNNIKYAEFVGYRGEGPRWVFTTRGSLVAVIMTPLPFLLAQLMDSCKPFSLLMDKGSNGDAWLRIYWSRI